MSPSVHTLTPSPRDLVGRDTPLPQGRGISPRPAADMIRAGKHGPSAGGSSGEIPGTRRREGEVREGRYRVGGRGIGGIGEWGDFVCTKVKA